MDMERHVTFCFILRNYCIAVIFTRLGWINIAKISMNLTECDRTAIITPIIP